MMQATFPLAQMGRLERVLQRLDQLPRRTSAFAAPDITAALQKEFSQGRDPHGRPWKKLATGKPSHLTASKKLRRQTRAALLPGSRMGLRILFGSRARVAGFHQTGTGSMPARRILPDKGLPVSWRVALERAHRKAFQAITRAQ